MIPKLCGTKKDGRGRSFKSLFTYILHDKGQASTRHRVAWAEPINCGLGGNVSRAWYEMVLTWENRAALKRAAGIPLTGRDNERPVMHFTLSWHPSQKPDRQEMWNAALSALDWLGLSEHQAVVAAHNDEPQPHVHIAVNTVHPESGRTANLYQCKKTLSAWALHWEETHGGVIVGSRALAKRDDVAETPENHPSEAMAAASAPALPASSNDNDPQTAPPPAARPVIAVRSLRSQFRRAVLALVALSPLLILTSRMAEPRSRVVNNTDKSAQAQGPPFDARSKWQAGRRYLGLHL